MTLDGCGVGWNTASTLQCSTCHVFVSKLDCWYVCTERTWNTWNVTDESHFVMCKIQSFLAIVLGNTKALDSKCLFPEVEQLALCCPVRTQPVNLHGLCRSSMLIPKGSLMIQINLRTHKTLKFNSMFAHRLGITFLHEIVVMLTNLCNNVLPPSSNL